MCWRLVQWILSIFSSAPSPSSITVCTAGNPQLFICKDTGGSLSLYWKWRSNRKQTEQTECRMHSSGLCVWKTRRLIVQCRMQIRVFHIMCCQIFALAMRGRVDRGQACWVRGCSAFHSSPQGHGVWWGGVVTWLQKEVIHLALWWRQMTHGTAQMSPGY